MQQPKGSRSRNPQTELRRWRLTQAGREREGAEEDLVFLVENLALSPGSPPLNTPTRP